MPRLAILGSIAIHLAVAALLLWASHQPVAHSATSVSIFEPAKPKPPPPKPKVEPPKPPPPKPIAKPIPLAVPVAAPPPPPVPTVAPPPTHAAKAPVALGGLQFSNDSQGGGLSTSGPGLEVGGGGGPLRPAVPESRMAKRPRPAAAQGGEESPCLEEPTKPVPIFKPEIEYTTEARSAGVEGQLDLKLTVGADGTVAKVDVLSPVDPGLDAASVATARQWRFKPSTRCGKAVAGGVYKFGRRFELGD